MQTSDLRDYLAAERTFLAWIRTGLALMGFGFVVSRFGLFLHQLQFVEHQPAARSYGLSLWFGNRADRCWSDRQSLFRMASWSPDA